MIEPDAMFPVLVTDNLDPLKEFYLSNFGFQAVFYDPDFYLHLMHPKTGIQLGFLIQDHAEQPAFLLPTAGKEGMVITFEVSSIENALSEAERLGLELAMELKAESWGQTHFMVRDPAGFVIDIVEQATQD